MYCNNCGSFIEPCARFCQACGTPAAVPYAPPTLPAQPAPYETSGNRCPKCGGMMIFQNVSENKQRGCFGIFFWILLCLCTCFLILLIPALRGRKSRTRTYAVCQNCGYSKRV